MNFELLKNMLPEPVKKILRPIFYRLLKKETQLPMSVPTSPQLVEYLKSKCKKNRLNLVLRDGFGDCLFIVGMRNEIEARYNAKIHFLIKPSCEFLMRMYKINDYEIVNELSIKDTEQGNYINKTPQPRVGEIFFPHPRFNKTTAELQYNQKTFSLMWKEFLIPSGDLVRFQEPVVYPQPSKKLLTAIKNNFSNVIVLLPEAHSSSMFNIPWWNDLAKELISDNYTIVCNAIRRENRIRGTINNLDLSMEDLIALCINAKAVISVRNGLCDICHELGGRLIVLYDAWAPHELEYFSLNKLFNRKDIHEYANSKDISVKKIRQMIASN